MIGVGLGLMDVLTRGRRGTPQAEPQTFWLDAAYDSRVRIALTNTSGADQHDPVVTTTVQSSLGIDANSLRVVESWASRDAGLDLAFDWRYGVNLTSTPNHWFTLPCYKVNSTQIAFKALGFWPAGETRYFYAYWNSAGGIAAPSYNYLGGVVVQAWSIAITAGTGGDGVTTGDQYIISVTTGSGTTNYTKRMVTGETAAQIATALRTLVNAGSIATAGGSSATVTVSAVNASDPAFVVSTASSTVPGNIVLTVPNAFGIGRVGPDVSTYAAASYGFGLPYNNGATILTTPAFNRISSNNGTTQGVRLGQYRVNGDGTTYKALTSAPKTDGTGFVRNGPTISAVGDVTFSTRSGGVDWSATYTCDYRHRFVLGRKSDSVPYTVTLTRGSTNDVYAVVVNGTSYSYTQQAGDADATAVAVGLTAAINAGTLAQATNAAGVVSIIPRTRVTTFATTGSTTPANLVVVTPSMAIATVVAGSNGNVYTLTIGGGTYSYTQAGVDDAAAIATQLASKINASGVYGTATRSGAVLTITPVNSNYGVTNVGTTTVANLTILTAAPLLLKYVDVAHVVLTQTCQRAYTPGNIANNVTATSNFDFISLCSTNNNFTSNTTEATPNKVANFSAPISTGVITSFGASADLSGLSVTGTVLGTHGNTNGWGVLVNSASYTGFGSQTPEFKWAATSNPFAVLQFRNVSNGSTIPQGAQVVIDFWIVSGFTGNATTVGDNLLPDEIVDLLRTITAQPTATVSPKATYIASGLAETVRKCADTSLLGLTYFRNGAPTVTGVTRGYPYRVHARLGGIDVADDDDGSYSVAFGLMAYVLRYMRTGDTSLMATIENYVQYFIDIEAATRAKYNTGGSTFWDGAISYWYWPREDTQTYPTDGGIQEASGSTGVDPQFGSALAPITYGTGSYPKGTPRRKTSIDQMHIATFGLWHYLYLLRNDPNISASVRTNALALLNRMATFEATWYAAANCVIANCYAMCTGATQKKMNGIDETYRNTYVPTAVATPFTGDTYGDWQVSNGSGVLVNASANQSTDDAARALYSPDSVEAGLLNYIAGKAMDMLGLDMGRHDTKYGGTVTSFGTLGSYPPGWSLRANVSGNTTEYESTRVSASNNGFSTDKHLLQINGGARDHMSGRAAQRAWVLAFRAMLDPSGVIPTEQNGSTVLRSVAALTAVDDQMRTLALYGTEPVTKGQRYAIAGWLGKTTTYDPQISDHAATAYWAAACEMWLLLQDVVSGTKLMSSYFRFEGTAAPEYRRTVAWGPYVDSNRMTTAGADTVTPMVAAAVAGNGNAVFLGNHSLRSHETTPHQFYPAIRAQSSSIKLVVQDTGRWSTTDPPDSWGNGWFGDLTHEFTRAVADQFTAAHDTFWASKTHILGVNVKDDAAESGQFSSTSGQTIQKAEQLIRALRARQPSRFAQATVATIGAMAYLAQYDPRIAMTYRYPFGTMQASGGFLTGGPYIWTPEGQLKSSRNSNCSSHDYADELAAWLIDRPKSLRLWVAMQTHCTLNDGAGGQTATPTSATQLRYPYASEIPMYTFINIGRGVSGFLWFTYNDEPAGAGGWFGYGNAAQSSIKSAIDSMGARLASNKIQDVLRVAQWDVNDQPFDIVGGGEALNSYSKGFVSALKDPITNTYYVVAANYGLVTQNVQITSATLTGTLKSLESGTVYNLASNISLGKLDGSIYRFVPA